MLKRSAVGVISMALVFGGVVWAQQDSRSGAVRPQAASAPAHAVQIAGRVSRDGKLLVSEDEEQWVIGNPGALRGQEGHWVTVKCQLSSDQSRIHVLSVRGSETSRVAQPADAAFRR